MAKKQKEDEAKPQSELMKIIPLSDFKIKFNEFDYDLKKGEEIEVHKMFLQNLRTEKIIK